MRYYDITISVPKTQAGAGQILTPKPFQWLYRDTSYTSFPNGKYNPNAMDIQFEIRNFAFSQPGAANSGSFVRIWGVSREELDQSNDLNEREIVIKGGMTAGLPLAKPEQAGVLAAGRIYQAFGNWINNNKSLDLLIYGPPLEIRNFQFVWKRGTSLEAAIKNTLATAMPEYQPKFAINSNIQTQNDQNDTTTDFFSFSQMINRITNTPINRGLTTLDGSTYTGVTLTEHSQNNPAAGVQPAAPSTPTARGVGENKSVWIYDRTKVMPGGATAQAPLILKYEDFIGQPTWIAPSKIQFNLVLRADLKVGDYVKIPEVAAAFAILKMQSSVPGAAARDKMNFGSNNAYQIVRVLHSGRFREPGAESWISTYDATFGTTSFGQTTAGAAAP